jgi:gamma-glutamylcyclotransferase
MPNTTESSASSRQLYFAYGSNLWLGQMAARCPHSSYVGRAILVDYRWQTNERGYANVVPTSGYTVHGLIYELGAGDEARLDVYEGVSNGAYSKAYLPVILYKASATVRVPTRSFVEKGFSEQDIGAENEACLYPGVLTYVSCDFIRDGRPHDEYIARMNFGIRDAIEMGVPEDFFENSVRAWIPKEPVNRHVSSRQI